MSFNFDLFIDILWLGTICGIISTVCLQKIKETTQVFNYKIVSMIINILIGFSISRLFTNLSFKLSLCVGFITWIGAETIYEKLNNKKIISRTRIEPELDVDNNKDINNKIKSHKKKTI